MNQKDEELKKKRKCYKILSMLLIFGACGILYMNMDFQPHKFVCAVLGIMPPWEKYAVENEIKDYLQETYGQEFGVKDIWYKWSASNADSVSIEGVAYPRSEPAFEFEFDTVGKISRIREVGVGEGFGWEYLNYEYEKRVKKLLPQAEFLEASLEISNKYIVTEKDRSKGNTVPLDDLLKEHPKQVTGKVYYVIFKDTTHGTEITDKDLKDVYESLLKVQDKSFESILLNIGIYSERFKNEYKNNEKFRNLYVEEKIRLGAYLKNIYITDVNSITSYQEIRKYFNKHPQLFDVNE